MSTAMDENPAQCMHESSSLQQQQEESINTKTGISELETTLTEEKLKLEEYVTDLKVCFSPCVHIYPSIYISLYISYISLYISYISFPYFVNDDSAWNLGW